MATALRPPEVRRFSRVDYARLAEAGVFAGERVELLDGELYSMSPQSARHAGLLHRLLEQVASRLPESLVVRVQAPVALDERSEPEPDLAVCRRDPGAYMVAHPTPEQVQLLVEVADSSLAYDRGKKAAIYARAGVPEVWIVDIAAQRVIVLRDPDGTRACYRSEEERGVGTTLTLPGGALLPAADIFQGS